MVFTSSKLKSVDFYRKIPRDLTEASLSGAGLSIIAAVSMMLLFGMELHNYLAVSTSTYVVVDRSSDGDFLRIDFNISFPALSCEFASVDVSDVLGTMRKNITNHVAKYPIDSNLRPIGHVFHSERVSTHISHGDDIDDVEQHEAAMPLNAHNFDDYTRRYPILVVNFYTSWCYWSQRLKPAWEKAAKIMRERYDPEIDGRILLAKVDCIPEAELCKKHHIQGYPSIRIFRRGSDLRDEHGHHEHEAYYGDRDTDSLVLAMEDMATSVSKIEHIQALEDKSDGKVKRPAPPSGGCRVEGFVKVKKVPGDLIVSARSGVHSFDSSLMNVSHIITHFSFGKKLDDYAIRQSTHLVPNFGRSYDKLSGQSFINHHEADRNVTIEHYLQVVKTEVSNSYGVTLAEEYEYTAHSSLLESVSVPVTKFRFELSPMQVLIAENEKSFSHFLTNICAIIGGVFTVAGILDSIFHNTIRLMKKSELGKNF